MIQFFESISSFLAALVALFGGILLNFSLRRRINITALIEDCQKQLLLLEELSVKSVCLKGQANRELGQEVVGKFQRLYSQIDLLNRKYRLNIDVLESDWKAFHRVATNNFDCVDQAETERKKQLIKSKVSSIITSLINLKL